MSQNKTTIKDIALKLGVHHSTVSRALNNNPQIPAATRTAVLRLAEEMGYQPHYIARSLVSGRTNCIGLIVPAFTFISNPVVAQNLAAIGDAAESRQYTLLFHTYSGSNPATVLLDVLRRRQVDGLILITSNVTAEMERILERFRFPVVFLDAYSAHKNIHAVFSDNHAGCRRMVHHLVARGHKRIGMIVRDSYQSGRRRLAGYNAGLRDHGIRPDQRLIGSLVHGSEADLCGAMLKLRKPPTAFFCTEFRHTLLLLEYFEKCGITIPRDMALVSYDDIMLFDRIQPPLTTLRQNARELGRIAVELLDMQIRGKESTRRRIAVPVELVVRKSCGIGK